MTPVHRRSPFLALLLVGTTVASALAAPGGVNSSAPPTATYKSDAPPARDARHSVAPDGTATYTVPFDVPPGRAGAQPTVALQYSSRGALRGGIAAGWSLPIPMIAVDTTEGRVTFDPLSGPALGHAARRYQVGGRLLIPVAEPRQATGVEAAYRADGDSTYTRYEHWNDATEPGYWVARHLDGSVAVYGQTPTSRDQRVEDTMLNPTYGGQGRWFLTSTTDANGNRVDYTYQTVLGSARNGTVASVPVDIMLSAIEYGKNVNVTSSVHHARVAFTWQAGLSTCPGSAVPIGAQFTYRTGIRVYEGAKKLLAVTSYVRDAGSSTWSRRRELALGYTAAAESCTAPHAPQRQLATVQLRAWTATDPAATPSVVLPPTTFTYGALDYAHPTTSTGWVDALTTGKSALSTAKPGGWPTLDSTHDDLDGNGIIEKYTAALCPSLPRWPWKGTSPAGNGPPEYLRQWEGCSLAAQVTKRGTNRGTHAKGSADNYYGYRFLDVNGDDRPDLLTALTYNKGGYRPTEDPAVNAGYPACSTLPAPPCMAPNGERIACLFAPRNQWVAPADAGYGSQGGSAPLHPPGLTFYSDDDTMGSICPFGTCLKDGNCTGTDETCCGPCTNTCPASACTRGGDNCVGSPETCCSTQNCADQGCELCAPMPDKFNSLYQGNVGEWVFEVNGVVPPQHQDPFYGHVPDLHCGYYVYRVHLNQSTVAGPPVFGAARIVRSPVPIDGMELATDFGSGDTANASAFRAVVDLDGDDRPDALYVRPNMMGAAIRLDGQRDLTDVQPERLKIWLGSKSGLDSFVGTSTGEGLAWQMPVSLGFEGSREVLEATTSSNVISASPAPGFPGSPWGGYHRQQAERVGLHDINGDGLRDLVRTEHGVGSPNGAARMRVFYNTGAGFEQVGTILSDGLPGLSRRLRWGGKMLANLPDELEVAMMSHRPLDLDGDGLLDVIEVPAPAHDAYVRTVNPLATIAGATVAHISTGDRLIAVDATARYGGFRRAFAQVTFTQQDAFRTVSDFVDVNGDGQPDMVMPNDHALCGQGAEPSGLSFQGCGIAPLVYAAPPQPLRLLTGIDNGRGARVAFSYASMRDPAVVTRDSTHDRTLPAWVVRSSSVTSGTATATTTHSYANPVFNYDRQQRFGFRGFETVSALGPEVVSGARSRSVTSYRYDLEPTGLVAQTRTVEVTAAAVEKLVAVTDHGYVGTPLFNGTVVAHQQSDHITSTCATPVVGSGPAAVASCLAGAAVARVATQWTPRTYGHVLIVPVAYSVTKVRRLPTRADSTANVRHDDAVTDLRYDAATHQLVTIDRRTHDSANLQLARVHVTPDAAGNPLEEDVYVDDTTFATTSRTYDARGNVSTVRRPNQQAEWMPLEASIVYDAHRLYPRVVTNELGHQTVTTHDLATGAELEWRGPTTIDGKTAVRRTQLDALGRVIRQSRGMEMPSRITVRDVLTVAYVDSGSPSITTRALVDDHTVTPRWSTTVARLDALGRVIREEQLAAEGTAVTTFGYDPAGRLVQVTAPSPTGSGSTLHRLAYDGLGRTIRAAPPLQAPQDTTYSGLTTIHTQTATDGVPSQRKEIDRDGFGRVVAVAEGVTSPAITAYQYDEADRLVTIIDADGVETELGYDHRGLRTSITRGTTTLRYRYDLDGNRVELRHPTGTAAFDPAKDLSQWSYDALDRLTVATPAPRAWTVAQQRRYGRDGVTADLATRYTYDQPDRGFGIGQLTRVETPVVTTDYTYTDDGVIALEARAWSLAPAGAVWSGTASQTATYGPQRNLLTVAHADAATTSSYSYDDRGRPARVDVAGGVTAHARFVRNAAGYVTTRLTPTPDVLQSWTRDAAGRVAATDVKGTWGCAPSATCPIAVVGGEAATFNSLGNIATSTERGQGRTLQYTYDDRDQLVGAATAGNGAYVASFQYSGAGRLARATVASNLAGAQVTSRDVRYDYAPRGSADTADPAAVRALRDVLSNQEIASLFYDASGNLITRTSASGTHTFIYDGSGRLREAADTATGGFEIYYYDQSGDRVLTYRGGTAAAPTVRHRFGATELFHALGGPVTRSTVDVSLGETAVLRVTRAPTVTVEQLFHGVLGSLLVTTDASGRGTARFGYGPFGELLYQEGPAAAVFDHRYNGKAHDALTSLRYYGARYYDPLTLSWTQADPLYSFVPERGLMEPRRMSLYSFSLNNPVRHIDPDGLDSQSIRQEPNQVDAALRPRCPNNQSCPDPQSTSAAPPSPERLPVIYFLEADNPLWDFARKRVVDRPLEEAEFFGHEIKYVDGANIHDLRAAAGDPRVVGIFIMAHGKDGDVNLDDYARHGGAGGPVERRGKGTAFIKPSDVEDFPVSATLKFVSFVACDALKKGDEWSLAFAGATIYAYDYAVYVAKVAHESPVRYTLEQQGIIPKFWF